MGHPVSELVLLIFALVFLILAACNTPSPSPRVNWGWLGMTFWLLSIMLPALIAR